MSIAGSEPDSSGAPEKRLERIILIGAVSISMVGHVGLIEGLGAAARRAPRQAYRPMEFTVVQPPPPKIEPPPEKKPEPPKPKEPIKIEKLVEVPPPPNTEEPAPVEPAKPVFGISMSSVVGPGSGSSFTVRVGNTLMKAPDEDFTPANQVKPYRGEPVSLHKVNTLPRPKRGQCEGDYPAEAKAAGIEGKVRLEVEVRDDGTVGEVTVIKGVGHGLDEAAVAALKKCAFSPAMIGDQAVATKIPYTYTFIIEE